MSDAWLVIGIFAFAFILWVSTGGPTRPISFAGPFITPITDVDDTQSAYGDDINMGSGGGSGLWSVRSIFGRFENSLGENEEVGPVSAQAGKVRIRSGSGGPGGTNPNQEYIVLRAESGSVDITGFTLVSTKSGAAGTIPQGSTAPRGSAVGSIVLAEGDEAVVTTGSSPLGTSFRENMCVGYLGLGEVVPAVSNSCPSPTQELGKGYTGSASSYDECRAVVNRFPRCEVPRDIPDEASRECRAFIASRLTYQGCVDAHFNDADFRGDTWRVYLNQGRELWRSDNESIRLLDREGKTVDIYSY